MVDKSYLLANVVWREQQHPPEVPLRMSDPRQYYWKLGCNLHVKLCTVQAATKQVVQHGCLPCDRCNITLHPMRRSQYEAYSWAQLEHTLETPMVMQFMSQAGSTLHGKHLGYVVEAKVLRGRFGAADMYVPALDLIIQVDGQHHELPAQLSVDARFDCEAHRQNKALLRLCYHDQLAFHKVFPQALHMCMQRQQTATTGLAMYTASHPQSTRPVGSVIMQ